MDWQKISLIFLSLLTLNISIYLYFIKKIIKKQNAGLVFIGINTVKDFLWLVLSIYLLDKKLSHFFMIIIIFIGLSLPLYYKVIQKLNQL